MKKQIIEYVLKNNVPHSIGRTGYSEYFLMISVHSLPSLERHIDHLNIENSDFKRALFDSDENFVMIKIAKGTADVIVINPDYKRRKTADGFIIYEYTPHPLYEYHFKKVAEKNIETFLTNIFELVGGMPAKATERDVIVNNIINNTEPANHNLIIRAANRLLKRATELEDLKASFVKNKI